MEITQIYAVAGSCLFICLLLFNIRPLAQRFLNTVVRLLKTLIRLRTKYLDYPFLFHRHWFTSPWSRAAILAEICFLSINLFCLLFGIETINSAGLRAANLSLINIFPAFAGPHLGFLADIFGISFTTYCSIHRSTAVMSCILLLFHISIMLTSKAFPLSESENLWGVIVSTSISSIRFLKCL